MNVPLTKKEKKLAVIAAALDLLRAKRIVKCDEETKWRKGNARRSLIRHTQG